MTVDAATPCFDPRGRNLTPEQRLYFAEVMRYDYTCKDNEGKEYSLLPIPEESRFSEFDLHTENGVQLVLDQAGSYTYSIFPSAYDVKSGINMNFYSKVIPNYKLECHNDPTRNLEAFAEETGSDDVGFTDSFGKMMTSFA